jgi:hypothetical protein
MYRRAELLESIARLLSKRLGLHEANPVTFAEYVLLEFVEEKTGHPRFEKVAALLRAACMCGLSQEGLRTLAPSYTHEGLEGRYKRFQKRIGSKLT